MRLSGICAQCMNYRTPSRLIGERTKHYLNSTFCLHLSIVECPKRLKVKSDINKSLLSA